MQGFQPPKSGGIVREQMLQRLVCAVTPEFAGGPGMRTRQTGIPYCRSCGRNLSPGDLDNVLFTTGASTAVDTALRTMQYMNNRRGVIWPSGSITRYPSRRCNGGERYLRTLFLRYVSVPDESDGEMFG